jgi:hypothetical protein
MMAGKKSSLDIGDDDWRSQLDSMYSNSEYNDLISLSSKLNRIPDAAVTDYAFNTGGTDSKREVFDAIRFPPVAAVALPDEMYKRDFEQDFLLRSSYKKERPEDEESLAALDFLENMLLSVVEKAIDIRASVMENGSYIYSLSRSPSAEEIEFMKTVIMENLSTLNEESLALMSEMESFQPQNVEDMLYGEVVSTNVSLKQLQASLLERSNHLKNCIAESALVVDGLCHYSNAITCLPTEKVCKLDGIYIDWSTPRKLQDKVRASNRSLNFADFMRSHGFPVCNDIYAYLQSTKSHGNTLSICGYRFKPNEFKTALDFFDLQQQKSSRRLAGSDFLSSYRSVKVLVIEQCELTDRECHALCARLAKFENLVSLSLRNNRVTYSGVASFASAVFETGSNLRCLRLDNNLIRSDGALFIAQVLHKLPFLEVLSLSGNPIRDKGVYFLLKHALNPLRSCARTLHKPSARWTASATGTNLDDEDEEDGDEEAANTETGELDPAVDRELSLTPQQRFLRRKIQRKCYFDDYFRGHFSRPQVGDPTAEAEDDEVAYGIAQREKAQWINKEEDEFNLDAGSEYSDTEDDGLPELAKLGLSGTLPEAAGGASIAGTSVTQPSAAELDGLAAKRFSAYGDCPKLVQLMIKLRVRLVAVNAFTRMLRTGPILTSLNVAGCKLTGDIVPTIAQSLVDNKNVLTLDLSHNPELLRSLHSCQTMAHLLEVGGLQTVLLNSCGVTDRGFMELTRGASNSRTVRNLELSGNSVGPTGANWAATANRVFFMDNLTISGDYHSSAPFKRRGDPTMSSVFDEEAEGLAGDSVRGASDEGKAQQVEDYLSDGIASYEDTDLFEGEDDEGYHFDDLMSGAEDSLELSAGEADPEEEDYDEGEDHEEGSEYRSQGYGSPPHSHVKGGTVVSQGSRASRASRASRGSVVSAAIKGVSGLVRQGMTHGRGKGTSENDSPPRR